MRFFQLLFCLHFSAATLAYADDLATIIKDGEEQDVVAMLQQREFGPIEQAAALQASVSAEKASVLARLLDHGFSPDAVREDGFNATALMFAAYKNNTDMMDMLVTAGADVNRQDEAGDPAINWAAFAGHVDAVVWLLEQGAQTDFVGHGNALEIAMRRGFTDIVNFLCKKQTCNHPSRSARLLAQLIDDPAGQIPTTLTLSDLLTLDETGRPLLHRVSRLGRVEWLMHVGADMPPDQLKSTLNLRDKIGFTALMEAARNGESGTVRWLIERGADINMPGSKRALSLTALHLAALSGHADVVSLLGKHHADLNAQDSDGNTAAMWAYFSEHEDVAKQLVEMGANPDIENRYGNRLPPMTDE